MSFKFLLFLSSVVLMIKAAKIRETEKETSLRQQLAQLSSKLDMMENASRPRQLVIHKHCQKSFGHVGKSKNIEKMEQEFEKLSKIVQKSNSQLLSEIRDLRNHITAIKCKEENFNQKSCKSNWVFYGGHCYFYGKNYKTWNDAENDCRKLNSHLVKVEGASENAWIYNQFKGKSWSRMWLGASDIEREGVFKWVNGSKLGYTNWSPNQPDNNGSNSEDCLHMWSGGFWNDDENYNRKPYLCEKNLTK